jgi:hypothetical protein
MMGSRINVASFFALLSHMEKNEGSMILVALRGPSSPTFDNKVVISGRHHQAAEEAVHSSRARPIGQLSSGSAVHSFFIKI